MEKKMENEMETGIILGLFVKLEVRILTTRKKKQPAQVSGDVFLMARSQYLGSTSAVLSHHFPQVGCKSVLNARVSVHFFTRITFYSTTCSFPEVPGK